MGVLTGYPTLIEIARKIKKNIKFLKFDFVLHSHKSQKISEKLEKNKKNGEDTNVCITSRIISDNFFRNNLDMSFFLLIFAPEILHTEGTVY